MFGFKFWLETTDDFDDDFFDLDLTDPQPYVNPHKDAEEEYRTSIDELLNMASRMEATVQYYPVHFPKVKLSSGLLSKLQEIKQELTKARNAEFFNRLKMEYPASEHLLKAYGAIPSFGTGRIFTKFKSKLRRLINSISNRYIGYEIISSENQFREKPFISASKLNWALQRLHSRMVQHVTSRYPSDELGLSKPPIIQPKQIVRDPQLWSDIAVKIEKFISSLKFQWKVQQNISDAQAIISDLQKGRQIEMSQGDRYLATNIVPATITALEDVIHQLESKKKR